MLNFIIPASKFAYLSQTTFIVIRISFLLEACTFSWIEYILEFFLVSKNGLNNSLVVGIFETTMKRAEKIIVQND